MSNGKLVLHNKLNDEQDSEDAMMQDNNAEYKGVFYNDNTEQKYYEHGAHFQFKDLCKRLDIILKQLSPSRRGTQQDNASRSRINLTIRRQWR